jgi:hypothetical protein
MAVVRGYEQFIVAIAALASETVLVTFLLRGCFKSLLLHRFPTDTEDSRGSDWEMRTWRRLFTPVL